MIPVKPATMLPFSIVFVILAVILFVRSSDFFDSVPLIILDTDISSDVDDVGAVAVLHALANKEKAKILAMMVSSGDPWSAPCLDALNTWFGRPDIPIGMVKGKSVEHESRYTAAIAAEFPQDIKTGDTAPDAVDLYRKVLSEQEDKSVIIVTIGYLTNLNNLLQSQPGEFSSLNGEELVRQKVKKLVCMGGQYPEGREWNFYQDVSSASFVIEKWPAPVVYCGFEIGKNVLTGKRLKKAKSPNPLRRSYQLYNGLADRSSWDQVTVLFALKESYGFSKRQFYQPVKGKNTILPDGHNIWKADNNGKQSYLITRISESKLSVIIEDHMISAVERVMR